jgi:hypothetical protein
LGNLPLDYPTLFSTTFSTTRISEFDLQRWPRAVGDWPESENTRPGQSEFFALAMNSATAGGTRMETDFHPFSGSTFPFAFNFRFERTAQQIVYQRLNPRKLLQSLGITHSLSNDPVSRGGEQSWQLECISANKFIAHGCAMKLSPAGEND